MKSINFNPMTMKTRNLLRTAAFMLTLTGLTLTGCQKDKLEEGTNDAASLTELSNDDINVEEITNDALQDVEGVLSFSEVISNRPTGYHVMLPLIQLLSSMIQLLFS